MEKVNEFTGQTYECECDYSYTCRGCNAVHEEYVNRARAKEREQWMIDSIQKMAEAFEIELPPAP